ncbi:MAG: class I SAM-dependent methyltransferase [Desulfobacteraceae bacterium]|nr:class I SAM-dependent methyltransferase [Desulfobacteraceae bacterium]
MNTKTQDYYDKFSSHLLKSFIGLNRRTQGVRQFLSESISPYTKSILEIGCGIGANVHYIARRIAPHAKIMGVDISRKNIEIAKILFDRKNITFQCFDVTKESISDSKFSAIILPDVYEHIPRNRRFILHAKIKALLSENGKVFITVPTPSANETARKAGNLQIIDEPVTLDDLLRFAQDIDGTLTYYSLVSVGYTNNYAYIIIEKDLGGNRRLKKTDCVAIKRADRQPFCRRKFKKIVKKNRERFLKFYVKAKLKKHNISIE